MRRRKKKRYSRLWCVVVYIFIKCRLSWAWLRHIESPRCVVVARRKLAKESPRTPCVLASYISEKKRERRSSFKDIYVKKRIIAAVMVILSIYNLHCVPALSVILIMYMCVNCQSESDRFSPKPYFPILCYCQ